MSARPQAELADGASFVERLRQAGARHYHHRHPFNLLMHAGQLTREDLRLWVANRYYYQTRIPLKDALILAKAEDFRFRRVWIQRMLDHDGPPDRHALDLGGCKDAPPQAELEALGGLASWRRLGASLGLSAEALESGAALLPEVESACNEYVELVRSADLLTAVAASLTEYFAGGLMQARIEAWRRHYPFVPEEALAYFFTRVERAPDDADFALSFVMSNAVSEEQQARCIEAFEHKCRILWRLLDAVYIARRLPLAPRLAPRASLRVHAAHGSEPAAVLLVPEQALELNRTALALLERCDGRLSLRDISTHVANEHGVPADAVHLDIASFVGELERRRLLCFEAA